MKEIHLMTNILQLRPLNLNVDGQPLCSQNKTDLIIDMSCYARILPPLETCIWSVPILFQFPPYAMMSPPKSSLSHHHITICLFLSSKNICCHPPFRMLRPCFKRKSEMRVNFVFRAALKSGVDTPSNLLSDSKSSVTKTVDIFLQCIWSAPLVTKCPEEKLRFPIGNMSTL